MPECRLLIATTSAGKLREWKQLLSDLPLHVQTLAESGIDFDVEETGATFRQNAFLKTEAYGRASGLLTLAEDSGLCVAALGGGPGVQSARWEGDDYDHKNALLIRLLEGKSGSAHTPDTAATDRSAHGVAARACPAASLQARPADL